MSARDMLIIKNENGEIIGAQIEEPAVRDIVTFIFPSDPRHSLYRVSDVPAEICDLADPLKFQKAITDHVNSAYAKIRQTSAEELQATLPRIKQ